MNLSIRKKSGILRNSAHGIEIKNGDEILLDVPDPGVKFLLDDIHKVIITIDIDFSKERPSFYKVYHYDKPINNISISNKIGIEGNIVNTLT